MLYTRFPTNAPIFTPRDKMVSMSEQYAYNQDLTIWHRSLHITSDAFLRPENQTMDGNDPPGWGQGDSAPLSSCPGYRNPRRTLRPTPYRKGGLQRRQLPCHRFQKSTAVRWQENHRCGGLPEHRRHLLRPCDSRSSLHRDGAALKHHRRVNGIPRVDHELEMSPAERPRRDSRAAVLPRGLMRQVWINEKEARVAKQKDLIDGLLRAGLKVDERLDGAGWLTPIHGFRGKRHRTILFSRYTILTHDNVHLHLRIL